MTVQRDRIDGWNLAAHDTHLAADLDLDGDGRAEIVIRSPKWIGLLRWDTGRRRLALTSIQNGQGDGWTPAGRDRHTLA